jgi:hypothetical protein
MREILIRNQTLLFVFVIVAGIVATTAYLFGSGIISYNSGYDEGLSGDNIDISNWKTFQKTFWETPPFQIEIQHPPEMLIDESSGHIVFYKEKLEVPPASPVEPYVGASMVIYARGKESALGEASSIAHVGSPNTTVAGYPAIKNTQSEEFGWEFNEEYWIFDENETKAVRLSFYAGIKESFSWGGREYLEGEFFEPEFYPILVRMLETFRFVD